MYLGLNISHDASAAILEEDGSVVCAVSEERLSRIKNHIGIPTRSISSVLSHTSQIDEVIIGTFEKVTLGDAMRFKANLERNPSNPEGRWNEPLPGYLKRFSTAEKSNPNGIIETELGRIFQENGLELPRVRWVNHHAAHLGCALGVAKQSPTILLSLDGEGDGESGAVGVSTNGKVQILQRIPKLDSLGNLYSAVTARYNFKPGQHEGKITGLAAYGEYSKAVDLLLEYVTVKNGIPYIDFERNFKDRITRKAKRAVGLKTGSAKSLDEIAMLAEQATTNYADLAYAIQAVVEIGRFWTHKLGINAMSLAGGVFANVKLNQKLSEIPGVDSVRVFPNMGDGGLSMGGVWSHLAEKEVTLNPDLFSGMYVAPTTEIDDSISLTWAQTNEAFLVSPHTDLEMSKLCAQDIAQGLVVAVHKGKMEFGPRALGNRSLLVDPRKKTVVETVNARLKRTEFMPFAPMVTSEDANRIFQLPQDLQPFRFMTMTCDVRPDYREKLPAITHVDGTARPQIVTKSENTFIWGVLSAYKDITGFAVLVNTSLNVHEEPINYRLMDSFSAMERDAFDVLYVDGYRISRRETI
jgi:carbamoyltransferase